MAGRGSAKPMFVGAERIATVSELDQFVERAGKGERFVYCEAVQLIRGETAAHARDLTSRGLVTTHHERRAGGGWNYFVQRTGYRPAATANGGGGDEPMEKILQALKRSANFGRPCPSDSELAKIAGLKTRDQAQWRIRKLIEAKAITSIVAYEGGVPFRVVTIVATGKRTALPGKWAALEEAVKKDAKPEGAQ